MAVPKRKKLKNNKKEKKLIFKNNLTYKIFTEYKCNNNLILDNKKYCFTSCVNKCNKIKI